MFDMFMTAFSSACSLEALVANFIGETNIIDGVMQGDDLVVFEDKKFPCRARGFNKNEKVDVVIRPEHLDIVPRAEGMLKGTVKSQLFKCLTHSCLASGYHQDPADPGRAHHGILDNMLHFRRLVKTSVNPGDLQMRKRFLGFFHKPIHTLIVNMVAEISGNDKDLSDASGHHPE